jgi:hypothetical protein
MSNIEIVFEAAGVECFKYYKNKNLKIIQLFCNIF